MKPRKLLQTESPVWDFRLVRSLNCLISFLRVFLTGGLHQCIYTIFFVFVAVTKILSPQSRLYNVTAMIHWLRDKQIIEGTLELYLGERSSTREVTDFSNIEVTLFVI
jgi:hypothetical protein